MEKTESTGMKAMKPTILGRIRKFAELTPMISIASICSVTRMVPSSEATLEPTLPDKMRHITVEENSRIMISRVE